MTPMRPATNVRASGDRPSAAQRDRTTQKTLAGRLIMVDSASVRSFTSSDQNPWTAISL
jgi:hypothetical protein